MSKENEVVEDIVEVPEIIPTSDESGNDTTDWKALAEERHALALKSQGIAKRFKTKLEKFKEDKPAIVEPVKKEPVLEKKDEPIEFDYGQKAYLKSFDIKGADELALVKNWVKRTGDELDTIVEDEIFKSKLTSLREAKASAEAIPKGNRRGAQPALNDESYWAQKIESGQSTLADIEDVAMRRKVLNKRIEKESTGNKFSSNPVITT